MFAGHSGKWVRKEGTLVQSSRVYEMHTKRLMAFEKRGQNNITQPSLLLLLRDFLDSLPWLGAKLILATCPSPHDIISSLSTFALPLSFLNHTQAALPPTSPPPPESPPLHSCTRYAALHLFASSSPSSAPRDSPPSHTASSPHQFYALVSTRSSCRNNSLAVDCEV
jgi:hypothetical protein